uniref:Cytochrome b/b6 N-terminal region profile domain-containing protein n=1 Tax=Aegilops tauschii subsp. strangulata TaxID=200361 RepID=A0A453AUN0_AEGTS
MLLIYAHFLVGMRLVFGAGSKSNCRLLLPLILDYRIAGPIVGATPFSFLPSRLSTRMLDLLTVVHIFLCMMILFLLRIINYVVNP